MKNWHRVCGGLYKMGDITVDRVWHPEHNDFMWHVIVDGETVESWAYLKSAKEAAHKINREVNKK